MYIIPIPSTLPSRQLPYLPLHIFYLFLTTLLTPLHSDSPAVLHFISSHDPSPYLHSVPICAHACTHAGFATLAQLAHLLCSNSLVCVHHLAHPRSGTLGISLSSTGTNHSHCIQHNVSSIYIESFTIHSLLIA